MRKLIVDNKITLDGVFDNEAEWLMDCWDDPDDLSRQAKGYIDEFDALLLGRVTYQGLSAVWPQSTDEIGFADWINDVPKHVVSTTLSEDDLSWNAQLLSGNVVEAVTELKAQSGGDILLVGSGELLETLIANQLVDEYRIWLHPIIHGSGTQLFTDAIEPTQLELIDVERTSADAVILTYQPTATEEPST